MLLRVKVTDSKGIRYRQIVVFRISSLFIQRMTDFVNCSRHALQPIVGTISRGDTHVSGVTPAREGMDWNIQSAFVEIKSWGWKYIIVVLFNKYWVGEEVC